MSKSSGSRRQSYHSRTRKEKQKKRHNSKLRWRDDDTTQKSDDKPNFPGHPTPPIPSMPPDTVAKIDLRIRGVPIEVESEIQALISQSRGMVLGKNESSSGFDDSTTPATIVDDSVHGDPINNHF